MKRMLIWITAGAAALSSAGCARIKTQVVEKPRVDQEISRGNRGYLKGSGPAGGPRSATRQMLETNIELPTSDEMNPWRKHEKRSEPVRVPAHITPPRPTVPEKGFEGEQEPFIPPIMESPEPAPSAARVSAGTTYVVQKGDTLEKIAKKFYGSTKKWHRIYKANQSVLKSPDRIRSGQKLTIPPAGQEPESHHRSRHDDYK